MPLARPTPAEERWLALASRYPSLQARVVAEGRTGGWSGSGWPSRLLYALLGIGAAVALHGALLWVPATGVVSGVLMILLAEMLVARRRVLRSGLEDALHACGGAAIVFGLAAGGPEPAAAALLALALSVSGLRMLNAAVTTLAALVASLAVALAMRGSPGLGLAAAPAAFACAAGALLALLAGGRRLLRPSHDRMLDGLVLVLPLAAWGWASLAASRAAALGTEPPGGPGTGALPALLALALGTACLATGLRRRSHAALLAALACAAGLAHALRDVLPLPGHLQWIGWGLLLLGLAVMLERALREPRRGFTSQDVGEDLQTLELAQLAAANALPRTSGAGPALAAEPAAPDPTSGVEGLGGEFGGGGASGRY
jgi:hypothetical protein